MLPRFRLAALPLLLAASHALADIVVEDHPLSAPTAATPAAVTPAPVSAAAPAAGGSGGDTTVVITAAPAGTDAAPAASSDVTSNWALYTQVQQLQQDVAKLRGIVEEQSHVIDQLRGDLRSRYTDLDQRLGALQDQVKQQATATPSAAATTGQAPAAGAISPTIEDEKKTFLAAYETFRSGGPDKAIAPMQAFVKRYPDSTFTPSAYYWLGEFYLNASHPDTASARTQFETVLARYPDHAKAPAALYKIGTILDMQGKQAEAGKKMQELLARYPKSAEAALADSYLKALAASRKPAPARKAEKKPARKTH